MDIQAAALLQSIGVLFPCLSPVCLLALELYVLPYRQAFDNRTDDNYILLSIPLYPRPLLPIHSAYLALLPYSICGGLTSCRYEKLGTLLDINRILVFRSDFTNIYSISFGLFSPDRRTLISTTSGIIVVILGGCGIKISHSTRTIENTGKSME